MILFVGTEEFSLREDLIVRALAWASDNGCRGSHSGHFFWTPHLGRACYIGETSDLKLYTEFQLMFR